MEHFGSPREIDEISFQCLRESVEEAPGMSRDECVMPRLSPLGEHLWNVTVGAGYKVLCPDHQIVCRTCRISEENNSHVVWINGNRREDPKRPAILSLVGGLSVSVDELER